MATEGAVVDDCLEGKFNVLEEAREIIGLSVEEFEEFFKGLCKCSQGHVWFKRTLFDVDFYLLGIGRKNYLDGEIELVIRNGSSQESLKRVRLDLRDLSAYFGRKATRI